MSGKNVSFCSPEWEKYVTIQGNKLTENIPDDNIFYMSSILAASIIFFFMVSFSFADIYKYVDENGIICYTDVPLNKKADRIQKDKHKPEAESSTTTEVSGRSSRSKTKDTSPVRTAEYHEIIHEKANAYNIDPSLIKAVIKTESNYNSRAVSKKGAIGLMQLMPSTANDLNVRNPYDPEENIEGGTKYLKYLLEKFNGNLTLALAAYNAGPKRVEKYGYVPPITETKQYVNRVLSYYNGPTQYAMNTVSDSVSDSGKKEKKSEPIYKIVLEDGTVLFTNSTFFSKSSNRF